MTEWKPEPIPGALLPGGGSNGRLPASFPVPGLWPSVWKLMRLRITIFVSGFRRAKLARKIGIIFLGMLLLAFLGFIFFLSWSLLSFLRSPQLAQYMGQVKDLLDLVPVVTVSGAFLIILLTSFGVLLQALYLAGDMDFLLSIPVPIRAVFLTKLLQAILPNLSLICLFALPLLWGIGAAGNYNFMYYPMVLVVLAALALAAAGFSSLLVMVVVRIFPARRVAEVLGFFGAIASFICSQSGQLANFGEFSPNQAQAALQRITSLNTPWSPLTWAGRGLVALGERHFLPAGGLLFLTVGLSALVFGFSLVTAERLYYSGWASMQGNQRKKKAPRVAVRPVTGGLATAAERRIPSPIRAILIKDYYVLRRDLRNMSQLVTPLIFGIVYAVMFLRNPSQPMLGRGQAPAFFNEVFKNIAIYGNVGISLFVGWMLLGRLAGMGFSQEGKSYWMLKTAPVSTAQLLLSKFTVAFLPSLALGWGFLLVISFIQQATLATLWFTLPVVALCILGNTGVNLTFGVWGANMNWEDPRHMQRGTAGCLGALASMLYLPISIILFFTPPVILGLFGLPVVLGQVFGLLVGGLFSLVCAVLPLWLVRDRVALLGEGG